MAMVTVGLDSFFTQITGEGAPVLVIPGLALDLSELTGLTDALADKLQVVGIDNLGAGRSSKPDEPYTLSRMAAGPAAVLGTMTGPCAVLGISLGSRIAITVALEHPELVTKLVLVSGSARVVRSFWSKMIMNTMPRLPIGKGAYPQPYYAFRRQLLASQSVDLRPRLAQIVAPTLIAHGKRDRTSSPALANELAAGIPQSTIEWFDGGHLFPVFGTEIPKLVRSVINFTQT